MGDTSAVSELPARKPRFRWQGAIFWLVLLVLGLGRLWLIAEEEIIASNTSYDALWYVLSAERTYWNVPDYGHMTAFRPPGYPLWLWANWRLHIPQRLAIDLAFIGAAAFLVYSLTRAGMGKAWACLAFALILLAPESFRQFRVTMADSFNVPLMMLLCGGAVMVLVGRHKVAWGIVAGLFAGAFGLNRGEGSTMALLLYACVAGVAVLQHYLSGQRLWTSMWRSAGRVVVPLAVMFLLWHSAKFVNYQCFGFYAIDDLRAPGHSALMKQLARIEPTKPQPYVTIPHESLLKAYEVSPTFRKLRPQLEGTIGKKWRSISSRPRRIPPDEILSGFTQWAVRDAANAIGVYDSPTHPDAFYAQAATEISQAIDSGRIPGRIVLSSYLEPGLSKWLPNLPAAAIAVWRGAFPRVPHEWLPPIDPGDAGPEVKAMYDKVARRDTTRLKTVGAHLKGAIESESAVRSLAVKLVPLETALVSKQWGAAPTSSATSPSRAIDLDLPDVSSGRVLAWEIKLADGALLRREVQLTRQLQTIRIGKGASAVTIRFDTVEFDLPPVTLRQQLASWIWLLHSNLCSWLVLGAGVFFVAALALRRTSISRPWCAVALVLVSAAIARLAMFSIIEASAWRGNQPRFVFPAAPVMIACALFIVAGLVNEWRARQTVSKSLLPAEAQPAAPNGATADS